MVCAHSTLKSLRHDDYHCGLCACGYEASVDNLAQVSLDSDGIFSDGYSLQLAALTGGRTWSGRAVGK